MFDWRLVALILGVIVLFFFAVPVKIGNLEELHNRMYYKSYLEKFKKPYNINSEVFEDKFKSFQDSIKEIEQLNKNRPSPDLAIYGFTPYADISRNKFKSDYLSSHVQKYANRHNLLQLPKLNESEPNLKKYGQDDLPKIVDWRVRGVVTKVKNQGLCGACWAFSTIGTAESMAAIKTGKLQELSVQEAIDCARYGNLGCNGGDSCNLLEWLVQNKIKIELEKDYPLVLKNDVCKIKTSLEGVRIAPNYFCVNFIGSETQLLSVIANHGPVTVAVNALSWQYYLGGVIRFHCDGSLQNLNHAVMIVGYNLTASTPYYIVKNSWGTSFGEKGYLKLAIGENMCGLANEVAFFDVL